MTLLLQGKGDCTTYWLENKRHQDTVGNACDSVKQIAKLGM